MNSQISSKYYYSKKIFKKEKKHIFSKVWIFAGFEHDFINENEYRELNDEAQQIMMLITSIIKTAKKNGEL